LILYRVAAIDDGLGYPIAVTHTYRTVSTFGRLGYRARRTGRGIIRLGRGGCSRPGRSPISLPVAAISVSVSVATAVAAPIAIPIPIPIPAAIPISASISIPATIPIPIPAIGKSIDETNGKQRGGGSADSHHFHEVSL
jgi:hypothetical protein